VLFPRSRRTCSRTTLQFPAPIGDNRGRPVAERILAIVSIALLTWINVRGVRTAAFIQTTLTAIKTAALAGLILLGITFREKRGSDRCLISARNFWAGGGLTLGASGIGAAMVGSLFRWMRGTMSAFARAS